MEIVQAKYHFLQAEVDEEIYFLDDMSHFKAEDGKKNYICYICKIVELFQAVDEKQLFPTQWYYRADDTVIKTCANLIDNKQEFFSEVKDDNPLDCLEKKLRIMLLPFAFEGQYGERTMLGMYSGCGGMSIGLCLSANGCKLSRPICVSSGAQFEATFKTLTHKDEGEKHA
ncbi:hypothetical protein SASPL_152742 [Salvia splendens]|uniref:BAH domain-containing protein n=1 Tax=Salvia splendens TaxID=180675 RepID=A0A8X8W3W8_SALSN|nr:hypothetical protein SASPL_152742 [Salvia splendens]